MGALRFVLGDQLSRAVSSLSDIEAGDIVLMAEVGDEATYVRHHKRKIAFLFSAMRHFADDLRRDGFTVDYVKLDDPGNSGSFSGELQRAVGRHRPERIVVTEPGEHRVREMMENWREELACDVEIRPDDRFLCSHEAFDRWADQQRELRMEFFYRDMRKRTGYLMAGPDEPAEGRWNFDDLNRERLGSAVPLPDRPAFPPDDTTREVLDLVASRFGNHFGSLDDFDYPVTRAQARDYLRWFVDEALPSFGSYQDAMRAGAPFLFHSHLSALMNCGLIDPREACEQAENAYRAGDAPINAVEGFIRQIIGWREFIRGVYWREMPAYGEANALQARRKLPDFFWTGETELNCLKQCFKEVRSNAYNHHIQRLMVIGNFCLLCGFDPKEVQEWYLVVYHDAYEWVEMPNVVGIILYADDGLIASKPYAASGNYIDRMSDYCRDCVYSPRIKQGEGACPFNTLYWDFLARNKDRLRKNPRLDRTYATLDRMAADKLRQSRSDAQHFLDGLVAAGEY